MLQAPFALPILHLTMNSRLLVVGISLLWVGCVSLSFAQTTITEIALPKPLNGALDAEIFRVGDKSLHVVGTATSYSSPDPYWDGFRLLYHIRSDSSGTITTTTFSDTGWYWEGGFTGEEYRLQHAAALDRKNNLILIWSKQRGIYSDIPPYVTLEAPRIRCIKDVNGTSTTLFESQRSTGPLVEVGADDFVHFAWMMVSPLYADSNFATSSSQLYYRSLSPSGVLSPQQFVGNASGAVMAAGSGGQAHLAWFQADSSKDKMHSLRYLRISSVAQSPTVTLRENVYNPSRLAIVTDSLNVFHAYWSEYHTDSTSRLYFLTYDGNELTIDSSASYHIGIFSVQAVSGPGGAIHALWQGFGSDGDSLYYASSLSSPPFSNVSRVSSQPFRFINLFALFLHGNGIPACVLGAYSKFGYNEHLGVAGDTTRIIDGAVILPTSAHRVVTDIDGDAWAVYGNGPGYYPSGYDIRVARITSPPTSVNSNLQQPTIFALRQNYPNPFNPSTTIPYDLPIQSLVTLKVFNVLGQEVATLVNGIEAPGSKSVRLDGSGLPSGVYFCRLQAGSYSGTRMLMIVK